MGRTKKQARCLVAALFAALIFSLCGCTFDIDKRAFISVIGIDKSELPGQSYRVTLKISLSKSDPKATGTEFSLLSADAGTVADALYKARAQTDKKLFFGQTKVILFGKEIARGNIRPLIDYFAKNREFQRSAYLAVAEPSAHDVLLYKPKQEPVAGFFLFSIFYLNDRESSNVAALTLFDAYRREKDPALDMAMPIVELRKEEVHVQRIALFNKSNIQLELNPAESRLFALLTKGLRDAEWTLDTKQGSYAMNIVRANAGYSLSESGSSVVARYRIRMTVRLEEKSTVPTGMTEASMGEIERLMQQTVQAEAERLLVRMRENKLDPIGFGLRYRSRHAFAHVPFDRERFEARLAFQVNPVRLRKDVEIED